MLANGEPIACHTSCRLAGWMRGNGAIRETKRGLCSVFLTTLEKTTANDRIKEESDTLGQVRAYMPKPAEGMTVSYAGVVSQCLRLPENLLLLCYPCPCPTP